MKKHREDFLLKYIFSTGLAMFLAAPLSVVLVAIFQFTYLRSPQFMALMVWVMLPALLSIMAIGGLRKLYHLVNPYPKQLGNATWSMRLFMVLCKQQIRNLVLLIRPCVIKLMKLF